VGLGDTNEHTTGMRAFSYVDFDFQESNTEDECRVVQGISWPSVPLCEDGTFLKRHSHTQAIPATNALVLARPRPLIRITA